MNKGSATKGKRVDINISEDDPSWIGNTGRDSVYERFRDEGVCKRRRADPHVTNSKTTIGTDFRKGTVEVLIQYGILNL
jgi:hypothetical protein